MQEWDVVIIEFVLIITTFIHLAITDIYETPRKNMLEFIDKYLK